MLPATRRWSASHFAQLVIIACLLSISLLNATPLPTAVPSLGLSDQSSYLHSQFSKRMEVLAASNAAKTVAQSAHELSATHTAATALQATSETKGLPSTSAAINSALDSKLTRSLSLPTHLDHTQIPTLDDLLFHDALPEFRTTQPAAPSDSSLSQAKSDFTPTAQAEPPSNEGHSQPSHSTEPHTPEKQSASIHPDSAELTRSIENNPNYRQILVDWINDKRKTFFNQFKTSEARVRPSPTPPVMEAGQSSAARTGEPRVSQSSETRVPTGKSESETSHSAKPSHPTVNKQADELPPKKSSKLSNFSRFFTKDYWKSFPKTSSKFSNFSRFFTKDYWRSFFSWKKSLLYRKFRGFKKVTPVNKTS